MQSLYSTCFWSIQNHDEVFQKILANFQDVPNEFFDNIVLDDEQEYSVPDEKYFNMFFHESRRSLYPGVFRFIVFAISCLPGLAARTHWLKEILLYYFQLKYVKVVPGNAKLFLAEIISKANVAIEEAFVSCISEMPADFYQAFAHIEFNYECFEREDCENTYVFHMLVSVISGIFFDPKTDFPEQGCELDENNELLCKKALEILDPLKLSPSYKQLYLMAVAMKFSIYNTKRVTYDETVKLLRPLTKEQVEDIIIFQQQFNDDEKYNLHLYDKVQEFVDCDFDWNILMVHAYFYSLTGKNIPIMVNLLEEDNIGWLLNEI